MKKFLFAICLLFLCIVSNAQSMVEISIEITELNENDVMEFGINWPAVIELQETAIAALPETGTWGRLTPFAAALKALEATGQAKVLSKPKLITKSGASAKFMVGGEIPLANVTMASSKVEWKEYGIIMTVTPTILANSKIDLIVETELSRLDYNAQVSGYPSIAKRFASSKLIMKDGETMVLAGLIENTQSKATSGIPLLSRIPFLGALFRTTKIVDTKTNVLVFVTPKILER
ncbi:MAG: type II and III secretion system protein [Elusimicrobiota bacterium]|jgi:type II secretory pathway component GspD/PulD (secretin)|nr:type II and III secretion system protein [Elusimicrobiota bacterium]